MKYVFFVFWLVVVIIGVTFAALNSHSITVNYYFNTTTLPLPILLLITLALGALLGIITMLPTVIRNKRACRRLKQRVKQVEQEVNNLRAIPIKESH